MEPSSSYLIPKDLSNLQGLINAYEKEADSGAKTENLKKINAAVENILENEEKQPIKVAEEIKKMLRNVTKVTVQMEEIQLWKEIMNKIEKISPTSSTAAYKNIPIDINLQIAEELNDKDMGAFIELLKDPQFFIRLLEKFNFTELSPELRFKIALRCGKELKDLDLSDYPEFDDDKLKLLTNACPNLESLNIAGTSITTLILPKGLIKLNLSDCNRLPAEEFKKLDNSFSKLEILNLSNTRINNTKEDLPNLPSLKTINVRYCKYFDLGKFAMQFSSFPNLGEILFTNPKVLKISLPR